MGYWERKVAGVLVILACGVSVQAESELTVNPDGGGDVPTIQEAIDLIAPGGTVYLGNGVFEGPGNVELDFLGKDFTLRSLSLNPLTCAINCEAPPLGSRSSAYKHGTQDNWTAERDRPGVTGIYFVSGEGPLAELRGISIINGSNSFGGGIFVSGSSPTISDCIFENNFAIAEGGAIYIEYSSATISRCSFLQNGGSWGAGVDVYGSGTDVTIEDCFFTGNAVSEVGGAIDIHGGANAAISFCTFSLNSATWGGAVALEYPSTMDIRHCTITENIADWGAGIYAENYHRCWFNIISYSNGGGAYAFNDIDAGPRDSFDFACCNFFGNVEGDWTGLVADQLGLNGNFSTDPEYCGMIGSGNLYLQSDSPCLALYNDCAQQIGAWPQGCGDSASRPSSWSEVKSMY